MAIIKKIFTSSRGTLLADIGNGLYVAKANTMELAICVKTFNGYKILKTVLAGFMIREQDNFVTAVQNLTCAELQPFLSWNQIGAIRKLLKGRGRVNIGELTRGKSPLIVVNGEDFRAEWIQRKGARIIIEGYYYNGRRTIVTGPVSIKDVKPESLFTLLDSVQATLGIMSTDQGHSEELVKSINSAWALKKTKFQPILCALYARDIDEITNADSFMPDPWLSTPQYKKGKETGDWTEYNQLVLEVMTADWASHAENYLMHIADDKDLQCILDFVQG